MVRSLHHIDDEDFDDTREAAIKHREALEAQEAADAEKKNGKSGVLSAAPIKEDAPKKDKKAKSENEEAPAENADETVSEAEKTDNNDQE